MRKFLKKEDLQLLNGGYLSDMSGNPVFNAKFVELQKEAEYIAKFAELSKGKDFVGKKADSLQDLKQEVAAALKTQDVKYIKPATLPKMPTTDKLKSEALAFMSFIDDSNKVDAVNDYLQRFNLINEFEEFGLFFEDEIVKLNKIYTMEEIVKNVESVIELVD